ncbi:MAG: ThuA domain-containing protein [Bacteroidales bacterium]|nr:ThuA domain-containing protein [Bacteroidales bacterium]
MKKTIFKVVLLITTVSLISCTQTPKVLLIVGGHSYDTTEFFHMFHSMEGIEFDSVSHPGAMKLLQSEEVDSYDLLLFYDFIPDLPERDSGIFLRLTGQGIPMLFLHHAICTFQEWDGYMEMVGGRYVMPRFSSDTSLFSDYRHDIDLHIEVVNSGHPVTKGVVDFNIHDEGYSNITVVDGVTPLLKTEHPDCSPLVGWVHSHNQSTIVYLMLGHDKIAYRNSSFKQLLNNSIRWLVEKTD